MVYEINRGEMFYTYKGGAAYLNNKEIRVSAEIHWQIPYWLRDFLIISLINSPSTCCLAEMMQKCHGLRSIGSAAVDLAYVACGSFDAFFEYNLNAWDVAAGAYLVQQAGGKILNFNGGNEFIRQGDFGYQCLNRRGNT